MKGVVNISAWLNVSNDCHMECRIDAKSDMEFTFGTWQGRAELIFERHALERFVELATAALNEPIPDNQKAARPVMVSRGSEIARRETSTLARRGRPS